MADQLIIDGLRVRLAGIAATLRATEQRLKALAADRATIQAAIRLFETEDGERPGAPSLGIQAGAFSRTVLDTLRRADAPLSCSGRRALPMRSRRRVRSGPTTW